MNTVGDPQIAYRTPFGVCVKGKLEEVFASDLAATVIRPVDLVLTSPPFPLNRKKKYGNLQGDDYIDWLGGLAPQIRECLAPTGSVVLEMGNSWEPGHPIMSTLALRALLKFLDAGEFALCQQFIWHNPARLPSPAQWVNVERIRVKDAYTHLWWMSVTDRPKANNRKVLKPYSRAMERLLKRREYNYGRRPSEYDIGAASFLTNNQGAIPSNVLTVANTRSNSAYLAYCRSEGIQPHPARMPSQVAEFFISFLTDPGDTVFDPFAGSNTTGATAERLERRWIAVEPEEEYIRGSVGHFGPDRVLRED